MVITSMAFEKLDFKRPEEKIKGFYGFSEFISPYPLAIENISRVWFKKLLKFDNLGFKINEKLPKFCR